MKDEAEKPKQKSWLERHKLGVEYANKKVGWGPVASVMLAIGAIIFSAAVLSIVVAAVATANNLEASSILDNPTPWQAFLLQLFTAILTTYIIYLYVSKRGGFKALGFLKIKTSDFKYALAGYGIYFVGFMVFNIALQLLFQSFDADQAQPTAFDGADGAQQMALTFAALVIIPPIYEEILFRGFAFQGLAKSFGFLPASIVVSGLFGLAHGQINVAADTFILGMIASYLVWQTKSIWPAIILHSVKNLVAYTFRFIIGI